MFYSQTFLARKGQLGTVWCAAHLQHRLKKSHYTSTNIPETVDLIMFPEVPLALRMSGHLLLGVVRIYSKKVDYFFRDCILLRTWVTKAFVSTEVDLPENARQAPVESVTLPQTLNLDEFELDADADAFDGEFDQHRRMEEDITLTDQIPTGVDPYVAVTFDEDIMPEVSPMDVDPSIARPGETDVEMDYGAEPNNELQDFNVAQDPGPSNITEPVSPSTWRSNVISPGSLPEIEIRRDAAHDSSHASHPLFAEQNVRVESTEPLDDTLNEKERTSPRINEEVLNSGGHSPFQLRSGGLAGSEEQREHFVHPSPQLVLQPTPPPQQQARPRKRKHFDKVTVLTNRIMRERLEDPSDILRKRKKMPASKLGVWRLNNQSKKDQFFNEPLLTGFSGVLRSVFEKDSVASKPYLTVSEETIPEPTSVLSPTREAETEISPTTSIRQFTVPVSVNLDSTVQPGDSQQTETVQEFAGPQSEHAESFATEARSPPPFNDDDTIGIERLRESGFPEYMSPPQPSRSTPSRTDDFTSHPGSSEMGSYRTEPSTSRTPEDLPGVSYSGLAAIPEMADEELSFLEVGGNTPVRSPASEDSDALTGRTRALAQYLKERSSSSPTSRDSSGDLSLNKILAGKTRKIAARMFYETMVLKSRGLINIKQDQPYSDIALKLKPALFSKVQQ